MSEGRAETIEYEWAVRWVDDDATTPQILPAWTEDEVRGYFDAHHGKEQGAVVIKRKVGPWQKA